MQDSKQLLLVTVLVLMATGACLAASAETSAVPDKDDAPVDREQIKKYLSMMDKLNIDQILNNTRLMINNIKCFLNEGPCSAQLKEMKSKWCDGDARVRVLVRNIPRSGSSLVRTSHGYCFCRRHCDPWNFGARVFRILSSNSSRRYEQACS